MQLDVLPRLSDEERDLLDGGYIDIPACPQGQPKPRLRLAKILVAITALLAAGCAIAPGLYVDGGIEVHSAAPAAPAGRHWSLDPNRTANPYGRLALGYQLDVSSRLSAAIEASHTSSISTSGDRGINAAALRLRWFPFRPKGGADPQR